MVADPGRGRLAATWNADYAFMGAEEAKEDMPQNPTNSEEAVATAAAEEKEEEEESDSLL